MDDKFSTTMRIDIAPSDLEAAGEPIKVKKKHLIKVSPKKSRSVGVKTTSTSHYQELLQSVYDAAVITDLNGVITDINLRATDFLRHQRDVLVGASILEIISGADDSLINTLVDNVENERFTLIQAHCAREDGSQFPAEIAVTHLVLDEVCLCFFMRDISIRKEQEEMLLTEHNAIHNAASGIAITNRSALFEYVNPSMLSLWGFSSADEVIGVELYDLFTDRSAVESMVEAVLGSEESWQAELVARHANGTEADIQVNATCNRDPDGELLGMVLSFVDIGDRKRADAATRQAEQHRVMLESLGAACHHLGQPATVILANLGIMERKAETASPILQELIKVSIQAAETLAEVLHKLNTVNEYRTTQYLERDGEDTDENRILDI